MFNHKNILTSNNKFIDVYDNLFSWFEKEQFLKFFMNSLFRTNGADSIYLTSNFQTYSNYNGDDVNQLRFYKTEGYKFLNEKYKLQNREIIQFRVNCSNSFEYSVAHAYGNGITLIYYVNSLWDIFWGGHTLFFNEDASEIEYTSPYKPGRVVVFDASIPHSISPISTACRENRYSFVIQYK